jgi:hypothetical protein
VGRCVSYKTRQEAASRDCFSPCCVVEMRGSRTPCPNKPIDEYATSLVDDFSYTSRTPIDRIRRRRPSGLKWWLEGGTHHSIPCFRRPVPTPQKKVGGTTHHWLLGSESVVVCRFGICCLSVVLRERIPTPRPAIHQPVRLSKPDIPR